MTPTKICYFIFDYQYCDIVLNYRKIYKTEKICNLTFNSTAVEYNPLAIQPSLDLNQCHINEGVRHPFCPSNWAFTLCKVVNPRQTKMGRGSVWPVQGWGFKPFWWIAWTLNNLQVQGVFFWLVPPKCCEYKIPSKSLTLREISGQFTWDLGHCQI